MQRSEEAGYRLVHQLACMDSPTLEDRKVSSAADLLATLVDGSTSRGYYWADPRLVRRLFWWQDTTPEQIGAWIAELIGAGEVEIQPIGMNCYSPGRWVDVLVIRDRRRFRRFSNRDPIPAELRARVYERDEYCCVRCGSTKDPSLDHIQPWSRGGPDTEENLQTLCRPCNSSKGARI